jgi:hypothetical protein
MDGVYIGFKGIDMLLEVSNGNIFALLFLVHGNSNDTSLIPVEDIPCAWPSGCKITAGGRNTSTPPRSCFVYGSKDREVKAGESSI